MGGVDLSDQLGQYYTLIRRTIKWWKKLFFHLPNLLVVNAYVICNKYGPKMTHFQLRLAVIKGSWRKHLTSKLTLKVSLIQGQPQLHKIDPDQVVMGGMIDPDQVVMGGMMKMMNPEP